MIDWFDLTANALWILSLSLILATISLARYEARFSGRKLGETLKSTVWQGPLNIAGTMFCCGLTFIANETWEQVLWAIFTGLFLVHTVWNIRDW